MRASEAADESRIASVIKVCLKRPADLVARFGGKEFACLLPDTAHTDALELAKELEARVRGLRINVALSGGVFQNTLLTRLTKERLERAGFRVLLHSLLQRHRVHGEQLLALRHVVALVDALGEHGAAEALGSSHVAQSPSR